MHWNFVLKASSTGDLLTNYTLSGVPDAPETKGFFWL